jgi:hypothetical protein
MQHLLGFEFKIEAGANAYCGVDQDVSTQALSDLLGDAKAQSITIWVKAFVLIVSNAEEWLEKLFLVFFRNSNALICH